MKADFNGLLNIQRNQMDHVKKEAGNKDFVRSTMSTLLQLTNQIAKLIYDIEKIF